MNSRTEFNIGQVFRSFGQAYELNHPILREQRQALYDISVCRTSHLGGHIEECKGCGYERPVYNSCGNISCPMCQGIRRRKWLEKRLEELLPVSYFHCIFTLPHEINDTARFNQTEIYNLLFHCSAKTLTELSKKHYKAVPAILSTLHTWGQNLSLHPHVHALVTSGGLEESGNWRYGKSNFLFNVFEMSEDFKNRFLQGLRKLHKQNKLSNCKDFKKLYQKLKNCDWVINCQKPFAGAEKVVEYLSRYVYRSAIANSRIKAIEKSGISFDYKDYRDLDAKGIPKHKIMKLKPFEFIRRFLQHILPKGFHRSRFYGVFAGAQRKKNLERCKTIFAKKIELLKQAKAPELKTDIEPEDCPNCACTKFVYKKEIWKDRSPPPIIFHHFKRPKYA